MEDNKKTTQEKIENLLDGLSEKIENLTDDEIDLLFHFSVDNPEEKVKQLRTNLDNLLEKTKAKKPSVKERVEGLKIKIQKILEINPSAPESLALAFRNKDDLSESDLELMIESFQKLGLNTDLEDEQ